MRLSIDSRPAKRRFASMPLNASGDIDARSSTAMRTSSAQSSSSGVAVTRPSSIARFGESSAERLHFGAVVIAAFIFLGAITGFTYFGGLKSGRTTVPELFASLGLPTKYVPNLREGGRYCLVNWGPYPMFGSPILIKTPHFSVQEYDLPCPPDSETMDFTKLTAKATP